MKKLHGKVVKSHYKGRKTRLKLKIERLEGKLEHFDKLRWAKVPIAIQNMLEERNRVQ